MFHVFKKTIFAIVLVSILFSCHNPSSKDSSSVKQDVVVNPSSFATLNLMPVPAEMKQAQGSFKLNKDFAVSVNDNGSERLFKAADKFLRRLDGRTGLFFTQGIIAKKGFTQPQKASLVINAKSEGDLKLGVDESYTLNVTPDQITLDANTDIGALRGLETLLQLLTSDEQGYIFPAINIKDKPRFAWRGLLIDVARHYQPLDVLKRNLDAMAAVKMNVMHFHLCDNQGWRVESKTFPKLHQEASDGLYYTQQEIKDIVKYAADLGIRVMPEFDVPGHATAILVPFPELGSAPGPYVLDRDAGIFDPVLNPTIDQTYTFLDKLFTEMTSLFPDEYFHIGGDENNGKHWKSNAQIQEFMNKNNMSSVMELQTYFNNRLIKTIARLNKKMVGWEEILQPGLSKDAVIHSWFGKESLYKAASQGYKTMLSNGFYIDLLQPASDHYTNDLLPPMAERSEKEKQYTLTPEQEQLILGGEATMWAELVTPLTIDSRIWPRTAAIAERLWSPGTVKDVNDMYRRLEVTSFRLEELGLTHIKNRDVILRNLANGGNTKPLEVLVNVIEPYKIYTRNNGGMMYKTYSPYTLMADAASADAKDARKFRMLVDEYAKSKSKESKDQMVAYLNSWKNNHADFVQVMKGSPALKQMEKLSEKLSKVASIGLEALEKGTSDENWYNEKSAEITKVKAETTEKRDSNQIMEDGRTELMVLDPVQKLVNLTNEKATSERLAKEEEERKKREAASVPAAH
ncbi:MAG: family 20 glycosylhydrolase [Cytophagaceae bacterium]|nr:family 20 glycosylhydrolase [Cytophagaceae bacterium]